MSKIELTRPTLIATYGYPGSGKTFFARQLAEHLRVAHIQSDRVRFELFEEPRYDAQEENIVQHLSRYMAEEFMSTGLSVVLDASNFRISQRRAIREMVRRTKADFLLVWLQIDIESAYIRAQKRDHRKTDDKYAKDYSRGEFDHLLGLMQKPAANEDYVVVSGKHNFQTQKAAVIKKLYDRGLVTASVPTEQVVKPGLVNLIPNLQGRVDQKRRNIFIR